MGSSRRMSKSTILLMKRAGIKFAEFDPVWIPFLSNKINHRNHRKILVVDGKVAITGGINIGDEYIHRSVKFGFLEGYIYFNRGGSCTRSFCFIFRRLVFCNG